MRRGVLVFCIVLPIVGLFFSGSAKAADWRFPVGFTYISGIGDIADNYEDNLEAEGYWVISVDAIPIGISFHPYVQFDNGFRVGTGIGPAMLIYGDADFFNIPINLNGGYTFFPSANTSPYVRGGIMYHIASGDYVEGTTPGFFGGIGVEFLRNRRVGFGIEIAYDTSEIELEKKVNNTTEDIQPIGLMVNIFAIF
ncbi:MAG: hypothetical protein ACE5IH_07885 [Thermodesulfobacteriota bacterium]